MLRIGKERYRMKWWMIEFLFYISFLSFILFIHVLVLSLFPCNLVFIVFEVNVWEMKREGMQITLGPVRWQQIVSSLQPSAFSKIH